MNILKKLKMSLKIFDGDPNMNTTESPGLTGEMKTYYSNYIIRLAEPKLIHDQFGVKEDIPKNGGKIVEFRRWDPLPKALTPLTEGVTPDGTTLEMKTMTSEVHQYGAYTTLTDVLVLTSIDPAILNATKLLGSQAAATLDTITREVINGTSSVYHCPRIVDGEEVEIPARHLLDETSVFTPDTAFYCSTELKAVNAPTIDGSYVAIAHPYVTYHIMRDNKNEWIDVVKYSTPENYFKGEIGKIGGIRFVETSEAKYFYAENLTKNNRNLTVKTAASSSNTIAVNEQLAANTLVDRYVLINGNKYQVTANTANSITIDDTVTVNANVVIYPGEAGAKGLTVFSTMVLGENAYGVTSLTGGGLEHIVKPVGSGGTADPLNQRSTVGWKATKTAERLIEEYMIRVESVSPKHSKRITKAN